MKNDKTFEEWLNRLYKYKDCLDVITIKNTWYASRENYEKEIAQTSDAVEKRTLDIIEILEEYKTEYLSTCGDIEGINIDVIDEIKRRFLDE